MSRFGLEVTAWAALDPQQKGELLRRPGSSVPGLQEAVSAIIARVRAGGDAALAEMALEFDDVPAQNLAVSAAALRHAKSSIDARLLAAINDASDRIREFHAADIPRGQTIETAKGLICTVTYLPQSTVGIYVPGGTAPLISTVLMLAIPAQLAGCRQVIMCSPPGPGGTISAEVLATASLCNIDRVFCVGGAQAIAAMAYGTATVPRCNKIFGPGNAWVTQAKQQVAQDPQGAAIDMPAGPSEVMVIADAQAGAEGGVDFITWDLLAQAEHGADSQVVLVTDCPALATAVIARLDDLAPSCPRAAILEKSLSAARVILVADLDAAMDIANTYAPEHLILNTSNARLLAGRVQHAGSVFIGRWTPESLGDYCSGPNHVLPTYGFARAHGALGVADFMRRMTLQEASAEALALAGPTAEILAAAEGLDAHRMAVRSRLASLESTA
jgi:histidinol dehydrogenase